MSYAETTRSEVGHTFFFDTYALVERLRGNANYARFEKQPIFTHQNNLLELAVSIARDFGETGARREIADLNPNLLPADLDDIFAAARFKLGPSGKGTSYVDALGYALASRHGKRFLTGDEKFKGLANVEFVK